MTHLQPLRECAACTPDVAFRAEETRAQTEEEEQSLTNMYASKVMMFVAQVAMGLAVPFAILYFASKILFDPKARALPSGPKNSRRGKPQQC